MTNITIGGAGDSIRRHEARVIEIIKGMEPWFREINKKRKKDKRDGRTPEEQVFDSGVFVASEFVRRLTGDESLSLAIHECCIWAQKSRAKGEKI